MIAVSKWDSGGLPPAGKGSAVDALPLCVSPPLELERDCGGSTATYT